MILLARGAAVIVIALATTWAVASLPFSSPAAGQPVCIVAGTAAAVLAGMWLPCPCHRKDRGR